MILAAFTWLLLGVIIGAGFGAVWVAVYGSPELNEQVRNLRKGRLDLQKAKTEVTILKLFNKHPELRIVVKSKEAEK